MISDTHCSAPFTADSECMRRREKTSTGSRMETVPFTFTVSGRAWTFRGRYFKAWLNEATTACIQRYHLRKVRKQFLFWALSNFNRRCKHMKTLSNSFLLLVSSFYIELTVCVKVLMRVSTLSPCTCRQMFVVWNSMFCFVFKFILVIFKTIQITEVFYLLKPC